MRRAAVPVLAFGFLWALDAVSEEAPFRERDAPPVVLRWSGPADVREVLLSGDTLYLRTARGAAALKASDGSLRWETRLPSAAPGAGPILAEGRLAVAAGEHVHLLDPATGRVEAVASVGAAVRRLAGPELVAAAGEPEPSELVRVDARSGAVLARRSVDALVEMVEQDGVLVTTSYDEPGAALVGLDPRTLTEKWSLAIAGAAQMERLGGKLHVATPGDDPDAPDAEVRPLDARSGALGRALPARPLSEANDFAWDLRVRAGDAAASGPTGSELFRISPESGSVLWTRPLPCSPGAWSREEDRLTLDCRHATGRDLLVRVDLTNGRLLRIASGLPLPAQVLASGDLVVVRGADGRLQAFDARAEGRLGTVPLSESVARIFAAPEGPLGFLASVEEEVAQLRELGPEAFPLAAAHIPALAPLPLVAAARFAGEGRYRPAAPALAKRLVRGGAGFDETVLVELLHALADVGTGEEAGAVAAVLEDGARPLVVRRAALGALAGIGTPAAIGAIDRALRFSKPSRSWYAPPAPPPMEAASPATAVAVPLPDGARLVVFRDRALGNEGDLWVSRGNGPPLFLGVSVPEEVLASGSPSALSARMEGEDLEVRLEAPRRETLFLGPLSDLARDSDGDGLPDVLERRLLLDPEDPDTDGDGIPDGLDLVPNAAPRPPSGEEEEIALALFAQAFGLDAGPAGPPVFLVSDAPLAWTGRRGATIVVPRKRADALRARPGFDGAPWLTLQPVPRGAWDGRPLAEDERIWSISWGKGGEVVLVRRVAGRWFLVKVLATLVS